MTSPYTQPEPLPPAGGPPYPPPPAGQYPPAQYPPPGQWGPGYQQPYYPPPPQKKKIPAWGWVLIALGGVFAVGLALVAVGGSRPADAGTSVRDGQFEFQITKVEQGATHVGGPGILGDDAQGEFVVVHVHVKNIGDQEATFTASNQKMVDTQGREFKGQGEMFGHKLNPGFSDEQEVAFDVPPGTTPKKFELHDSSLSGGVTVKAK